MLPTTVIAIALIGQCVAAVVTDPSEANGKTFDYIIVGIFSSMSNVNIGTKRGHQVGAGLTGMTVAARLAENSAISVLLIEAGQDDRNNPEVYNILNFRQTYDTALDWAWPTDQGKTMHG